MATVRKPKMEPGLADVPNPCEHGNDLRVLQVPHGSEVYSPTCAFANGNMRPHVIGERRPRKRPRK